MIRLRFLVLLVLAGCPEEVPPPADDQPPSTEAFVVTPSGGRLPFVDGEILLSTAEAWVRIDADEPATIYYTTDGTEARPGAAGLARDSVGVPTSVDMTVRWVAVDLAGNEGAPGQVRVRFDRDAPQVDVDPPGGDFPGPVDVTVRVSEPVAIWWTTHGVAPVPDAPQTMAGEATPERPLSLRFTTDTTLRVLVQDAAGNSVFAEPSVFVVDDDPPVTRAEPAEGHYVAPIEVRLVVDDSTATTWYTTDGSEPGPGSTVYAGPFPVAAATTVRFRSVDPGGNTEAVQAATWTIGPRAGVAARVEADGLAFPFEGGLALAAALVEGAGLLSGSDEAGFGVDWLAGFLGRNALDSALFQGGVGLHAARAASVVDATAAPGAPPDANGNGSALDEVFDARLAALAAEADTRAPAGVHPVGLFYRAARAELLRAGADVPGDDGVPVSEDDYALLRWQGARGGDREVGPGSTAAGLRALVARMRAGEAGTHRAGSGALATVEPVLSLRCGTCHRVDGAPPALADVEDFIAEGLVVPGNAEESRVLALLSGQEAHPVDRELPARVAAVQAWIEAGAAVGAGALGRTSPGATGREGYLALLAADTAGRALELLAADFFFDPGTRRLGPVGPGTWVGARVTVTEADAGVGVPRSLESLRGETPDFDTRAHGRLLQALRALRDVGEERPHLFDLEGFSPSAPDLAEGIEAVVADALLTHGRLPDGSYRAFLTPGEADAQPDALATAEAALAWFAVGRSAEAREALQALRRLVDARGDVRTDGSATSDRPLLDVQLAALTAFATGAARGDAEAGRSARALWQRLESAWWDAAAGQWQTTWGVAESAWTPDAVARALDALRAAQAIGLPDAPQRRSAFFEAVVGAMVVAETWLTGEFSGDGDGDGDGLPARGAHPPNGAAPVFWRLVVR